MAQTPEPESVIRLLPEALANQIAAGEVVQRPASAVKELLENARDAGADSIRLVLQDAGKALVQVIDNGRGMGPADARMAFERHATSKIRELDDLFRIRTFGFRGEALASIAAVAHTSLRTRRATDELGTEVEVAGGRFENVQACQCPVGTSVSVRNLFYNVPARRNFLKSNPVELRHILAEFTHIALAWPEARFACQHNNQWLHDLPATDLQGRVLALHDGLKASHLLPLEAHTEFLRISGLVGTPEMAKRTRGGQYYFVNRRFIRSPLLHHAVKTVFDGLIPEGSHPFYVLFLELDPKHVDINIHPTKTEVKFDDEHTVYALLHAAVRKVVGQQHRMPSFEADGAVGRALQAARQALHAPEANATIGTARNLASRREPWNPHSPPTQPHDAANVAMPAPAAWHELYALGHELAQLPAEPQPVGAQLELEADFLPDIAPDRATQFLDRFVLVPHAAGILVLDQQAAHTRVRYERLKRRLETAPLPSQQLLYPFSAKVSQAAYWTLNEHLPDLKKLGFELEPIGSHSFLVSGLPSDLKPGALENLLDAAAAHAAECGSLPTPLIERLLRALATQGAIAPGRTLPPEEAQRLAADLFNCQEPAFAPDGNRTYFLLEASELLQRLA